MSATGRRFGGRTPDERAAERRARLIAAALALVGEEGWPAATMTAVCRRAGLTERYFYESFRDRDDLHVALIDSIAARIESAVLAALRDERPGATPAARIEAAARALLAVMIGDPAVGRAALLEGVGSERVQRRRSEILRSFERLVRDEAARLTDRPPDAEAIALASVALVGAVSELVGRRLSGELGVDDDRLVGFVVAATSALLA